MVKKFNEIKFTSKFNSLTKKIAKTNSFFAKVELNKLREDVKIAMFANQVSVDFYNRLFA